MEKTSALKKKQKFDIYLLIVLMEKEVFVKLIESGWNLKNIGLKYGFSRQTSSNLFKKSYGITYREYREKLKLEKKLKEKMSYEGKEALKALVPFEKINRSFLKAAKKIYNTCQKNNLKFRIQVANNMVKEFLAGNKKLVFRHYVLEGRRVEEKTGFLRFRPPKEENYDILIVGIEKGEKNDYFIIPKTALFPKKSTNLPIFRKKSSKYSAYKNNWQLITKE